MRIGVSLRSGHAADDPRDGARWMVQRAAAAERAGLDSMFVGDHHATAPRAYYQNVPILGRLLAEWGSRPTGALFLLPLWHPVLLAEQVATLAAIAPGRFVLQCAVGGGAEQFDAMGASLRTRPSTFEAALDAVRRLLAGEEVTTDQPIPIRGARIAPVPAERVEVWIGAQAEAAVDRAARLGDGWIAGPGEVPEQARELAALYQERCAHHGKDPTAVVIRRDVYVGEDEADARATVEPVVAAGYRGFDPRALVSGTVDQVAESFGELADMGYTDVLVRNLTGDPDRAVACLERIGEVRDLLADR